MALSSGDAALVETALREMLDEPTSGGSGAEVCGELLSALERHPELGGMVAEVFASLGKEAPFRDVAASNGVVPLICPLIASPTMETQLQALRAVANLCFDHDPNRNLVLSSGGCPLLITSLTSCSSLPAEKQYNRLKCVACGCLLNVSNDNDTLCKELFRLGAVQALSLLLAHPGEEEAAVDMGLKALYVLLESVSNQDDFPPSPALPSAFSYLLGQCLQGQLDVTEPLLETLQKATEASDRLKLAVVEEGVVGKLLQLKEVSDQLKATDILVLLCAEDSCLKQLSELPTLLSTAEKWLTETSSLKRRASTALLIANIARTDEMCSSLISRGIVPHLLQLAETEEPEELTGKVHYSALSALRNLCLPAAHKLLLIEKGVLETALACLKESQWPHVHFKALGILRLLVYQQEEGCRQVALSKAGTVTLIVEKSTSAEHAHVKIEGSRLMAALVRHSNSERVMQAIVAEGGGTLIISLLSSEHALLRNEALVALNLLSVLEGTSVVGVLREGGVVGAVGRTLAATDSSPEVLANALTLSERLAQSATVREELCSSADFTAPLQTLCQHSSESVQDRARALVQALGLSSLPHRDSP